MDDISKYRPEFTDWFTSSRTNNGNQCVEVRFDGDAVLVRDSKYRRDPSNRPGEEPVITVTAAEWMSFLAVVSGRSVPPVPSAASLTAVPGPDGHTVVRRGAIALVYTPGEWEAFLAGVRDGEFDRVPLTA